MIPIPGIEAARRSTSGRHAAMRTRVRAQCAQTYRTAADTFEYATQTRLSTAQSVRAALFRPTAALALTSIGAFSVVTLAPSVAVGFWAAPVLKQFVWTAVVLSFSFFVVSNQAEFVGAGFAMTIALAAMALYAPIAPAISVVAAAMLGAAVGGLGVRHYKKAQQLALLVAVLLGVAALSGVALLLAQGGFAARR